MSRRAFTLAMVYANWTEPNIRCELFLRTLQPPSSFRVRWMSDLTEALWYAAAFIVIVLLYVLSTYALIRWL